MIAALRATREPQVDVSFPKSRSSTACPSPVLGRHRIRLDHGRLQPLLQLLRRAVHARRRE
jgi:hypothetical protein